MGSFSFCSKCKSLEYFDEHEKCGRCQWTKRYEKEHGQSWD